jgi:hypothetical protein
VYVYVVWKEYNMIQPHYVWSLLSLSRERERESSKWCVCCTVYSVDTTRDG